MSLPPRPAAPLAALLAAASLAAQPAQEGVDELFARARQLAFSGRRAEALELCRAALLRSPGYLDIRILMGRIHAWDGRYDEGRIELQQVLRARPDYLDARLALVDLELWSDHPRAAADLCDQGLALRPEPLLLLRKARALKALGAFPEALAAAKQALGADPGLHEARLFIDNVAELTQRSKLFLGETYDRFDRTFDPWHMESVSLAHRFEAGSLIGRVNHASRFGESGDQLEVDAYPRWKDGTYFYLNAGFSGAAIFPHRRYGAEAYHAFTGGIEGSLGLRHLRFAASSVTIYTGSLGKYWGDYLFSLRLNDTPSSIGASRSGSVSARRYFGDAENHLTLSLGSGVSPDQANPSADILNLRSRKASLAAQGWIHRRLILSAGLAVERQELGQDLTRTQTTFSAGLEWRF
jgi:YaiO family outer membrane protein